MKFKYHSLGLRFTILVMLTAIGVFGGYGYLSYFGMKHLLITQQDQVLSTRIERLQVLIQNGKNLKSIVEQPSLYENMMGNENNLFILKHLDKKIININPEQIPIPILPTSLDKIEFSDINDPTHPTRIVWKNFKYHGETYQIIAGKEWSERLAILNPYLLQLTSYSLLGLVFILTCCISINYYVLRSLKQLTKETLNIQIGKLSQRITDSSTCLEVHQLAKSMNIMLEKIELSFQQLSRFSDDIAHEFRTPLNNLIGQTQIILTIPRSNLDYQDLLYSHLEEYDRIKRMIDKMLFLARADQSNLVLQQQEVNLQETLENLLDYFSLAAEEKNIIFKIELHENFIYADPLLLQQAISNLLSNSINYGQNNQEHWIISQLSTFNGKAFTELRIITSNVKIDENHLPHLFERFYQCNYSRHPRSNSGGLGLSILESIVSLHNGHYSVKNTIQGVEFSIFFPIANQLD